MNKILYLLLLFYDVDYNPYVIIEQNVDMIEVNHRYQDNGNYQFTQLVFWDFSEDKKKKYRSVVDWRIVEGCTRPCTEKEIEEIKKLWEKDGAKPPPHLKYTKVEGVYIPYNYKTKRYIYIFHDNNHGGKGELRKIIAKGKFVTYKMADSEADFQKLEPKIYRKGLINVHSSAKNK